MSAAPITELVDVDFDGTALTIRWVGADARAVDSPTSSRIAAQLARFAEAERQAGLRRDMVGANPVGVSAAELAAAQRAVGEALHEVLDGPDGALTARLERARRSGRHLHVVVRLLARLRELLVRHPALQWPVQLVWTASGPLALEPDAAISLQVGQVDPGAREVLPGGRLRVLFMAYAPRDVMPVLDHEREEERILKELEPFIEQRRLILKVAEEGSVEELRRRLKERQYDVVHLVGHGIMTPEGPRLVMESASGARDDVDAERLLEALRAGQTLPRLLVISSCYSADQRDDLPSLAAELIEGGVSAVIGWTRPVRDDVAIDAGEVLYRRLCSGDVPLEAVAGTRRELHRKDEARTEPTHAWATLQLLSTRTPGFAIDPTAEPVRDDTSSSGAAYRMLGNRISVLAEGFVGRRRELQALGQILRRGKWTPHGEAERAVAGALVVGMKGQGKSCLVARALDRYQQDSDERAHVVLHGKLDESKIIEAFRTVAIGLGDEGAEQTLDNESRSVPRRVERLLRFHWRERRLVIVIDDFEQNLDVLAIGDALLGPLATELLGVLVPACLDVRAKLLMTSTARFVLDGRLAGALADVPLGALDGASVHKLWARANRAELTHLPAEGWIGLGERLGRNARILDWARQLLTGAPSDEVRRFMAASDAELRAWKDQPLDDAKLDALAAAFQRHLALADAERMVSADAMEFVERARVYDVPVPIEALSGLAPAPTFPLDAYVQALTNLGLLERSSEDGRPVYRVSPLVRPRFAAADGERWHGVAAEYWKWAALGGWHPTFVMHAWRHAIAAKRENLTDWAADLIGRYHLRTLNELTTAAQVLDDLAGDAKETVLEMRQTALNAAADKAKADGVTEAERDAAIVAAGATFDTRVAAVNAFASAKNLYVRAVLAAAAKDEPSWSEPKAMLADLVKAYTALRDALGRPAKMPAVPDVVVQLSAASSLLATRR